jgi:hypothetical protein
MLGSKLDDIPRINAFLEDMVDPDLIWKEIDRNIEAFSSETVFDGGFKLPPLLQGSDMKGAFRTAWPVAFHGAVRNIRNNLSHGKDQKTATAITPTTANYNRLSPWVAPMSIVAAQIVICQGIV